MRFQAPRGTQDVLPAQAHVWQVIERTFAEVAGRYGYREIRTPTFEEYGLFVRSSGETSEVVSKQMYDFIDKGDRHIALKPEGTAPAIRAVVEHSLCPPGAVQRLFYITPFYRYERPQKGRLREAHQGGLELLGSGSPAADAEVIEATVDFYRAVGLNGVTVSVNSLGRSACRAAFREAILEHVDTWMKDQSEEDQERARKNPLRLLDSKDPNIQSLMAEMPPITNFLESESLRDLNELESLLQAAGVEYRLAPEIVRGLDYYTGTVFEVQSSSLGAQSALCGGGRYDDLVKELGGPPTPAVGVGIGIERLIIALEAEGVSMTPPHPDAFFAYAGSEHRAYALEIARSLRRAGLSVLVPPDAVSLKSQLKQADRSGARFTLIVGEEEAGKGVVTVRRMSTGEQQTMPYEQLKEVLA